MTPRRLLVTSLILASLLTPRLAGAQPYDDLLRGMPASEPAQPGPVEPPGEPPPPPPPEPRPAPFGSRGQWVVSGSSSIAYSTQSFDNSKAVFSGASFAPALDWFLARNVSLGLQGSVYFVDSTGYGADSSLVETQRTTVRVGLRVGVNLPLGRALSFWPTAALGFEWIRETQSVVSGSSSSVTSNPLGYPTNTNFGPWLELDAALLWHVTPHVFVGVVPSVFHDFGHVQGGPDVGGQQTHVSGGFLMGGWFGGPPGPVDPDAPPPASGAPVRRFGEAGETVLSNELVLDGYWTGYAGSGSTSSGGALTFGVDQFVAAHFSIGGALSGHYGTSSGIDSTTNATVTSQSSGGSLAFRVGVDIPLGGMLSLWPRASLGFGAQSLTQQEATTTQEDDTTVAVGLYAPLLLHPASHFFVGFGPSAWRDLSHAVTVGDPRAPGPRNATQNPSTTLGLGLVVGGWL